MSKNAKIGVFCLFSGALLFLAIAVLVVLPAKRYAEGLKKLAGQLQTIETEVLELYSANKQLLEAKKGRHPDRAKVGIAVERLQKEAVRLQGELKLLQTDLKLLEPPKKFTKAHLLMESTLDSGEQLSSEASDALGALERINRTPLDLGAWAQLSQSGQKLKKLGQSYEISKKQLHEELARLRR